MPNPIANMRVDIGVTRDSVADTTATPVVTDIGVPTNYAMVAPRTGHAGLPKVKRVETNPVSRDFDVIGNGVPYNAENGITSY